METEDNKENLEKALNSEQIPQEEEIGIHKGSLNTLMAERAELIKMIANVEAIMQAHIARLKELGVEIKVQQPQEKKD